MTEKYIGKGQWSTRKNVFHTDPDCNFGPDNVREVSDEEIEFHNMRICRWCNGENPNSGAVYGTKLATKLKRLGEANDA